MTSVRKVILIICGLVSLLMGVLGIILPLLPTTPFLLLSAYCFGKSSKTLHDWLLHNKVFGDYIKQFRQGQGIPLRAKVIILLMLWASVIYSIVMIPFLLVKIMMATTGISISYFVIFHKRFRTKKQI
ncbi:YbaN family protein [Aquibacillus kalidii]|uniref:YbaN family protein n=1 Tax=Aquibacillus kalidii TaxID=2762597 RepID=UPI0016486CDC|nr:YbaN family protein [Aquibacillus kalidii]